MLKKIKTEPIPERVLEICRIISRKKAISEKELIAIFEPPFLVGSSQSIFSHVKEAAFELKLIKENDEGNFELAVDKNVLKNYDTFRRYCNSVMYEDTNIAYFRIARCIVDSNDELFSCGSFTSSQTIKTYIYKHSGIDPEPKRTMEGIRFWISFSGLGYIQDSSSPSEDKVYLPNAYVALKDFIVLSELEKMHEYTVHEFVDKIYKYANILLHNALKTQTFNLAMSNALRQLHDNKEIELIHRLPRRMRSY